MGKQHLKDGRWCEIKIPNSQVSHKIPNLILELYKLGNHLKEPEAQIFVGRLSQNIKYNDLKDYFSQYGQVIDFYISKPFRAFGFVPFLEGDVTQSLCGESHIIKGEIRVDSISEENTLYFFGINALKSNFNYNQLQNL